MQYNCSILKKAEEEKSTTLQLSTLKPPQKSKAHSQSQATTGSRTERTEG